MTVHRMIETFSAGQKSGQDAKISLELILMILADVIYECLFCEVKLVFLCAESEIEKL